MTAFRGSLLAVLVALIPACGPGVATPPGTAPLELSEATPMPPFTVSPSATALATATPTQPLSEAVSLVHASEIRIVGSWPGDLYSVAWSPDSSAVAIGGWDGLHGYVHLVRMLPAYPSTTVVMRWQPMALAFNPRGTFVTVVTGGCSMPLIDVGTGRLKELSERRCLAEGFESRFSPPGNQLWILDSASGLNGPDFSTLRLCVMASEVACREFKYMMGFSTNFVLLRRAATVGVSIGTEVGSIVTLLWSTRTGNLECSIPGAFAVADDQGQWLATWVWTEGAGEIALWDAFSCKRTGTFAGVGPALAVDPTNHLVVAAQAGHIRVLDTISSKLLADLALPPTMDRLESYDLSLSPDWRYVIASHRDGTSLLQGTK